MAKCMICGKKMPFLSEPSRIGERFFENMRNYLRDYMKNNKEDVNNKKYGQITVDCFYSNSGDGVICKECEKILCNLNCGSDSFESEHRKLLVKISNRKDGPRVKNEGMLLYINNDLYHRAELKNFLGEISKKADLIIKKRWNNIAGFYSERKFVYPHKKENSHVCATVYKNNFILIENKDVFFNTSKFISVCFDQNVKILKNKDKIKDKCNRAFELMKETSDLELFAISEILLDDIISYKSVGHIEHSTVVSGGGGYGGGVNKKGAVVGGLLFGGAGAIIGSQIDTEIFINPITSNIVEHDYRKTMLNFKNGSGEVEIKELPYYYAEVFQKVIPEKEFNFLQANKNIEVQVPNSSSNMLEEMKQLKELLDIGLITQEEFDSKRKQILKL